MQRLESKTKALTEPQSRRWTRKEYYRLLDLGFFQDQRVELIEGEIIEMPSMKNPHAVAVILVQDALRAAFGEGYLIRPQLPMHFGPRSEPEPDISVVPGEVRDYQDHPTTALLVVEISDTSLNYDRERKRRLYARAGIADYWIVNLLDYQLEVFRDPEPDSQQPGRFTYGKTAILKPNDSATPLAAVNARIPVCDLFP